MSELINVRDSRATIRWKLLTSASALVLTAAVSSATVAKAEDADHPLIWIDLGGQMENVSGQGEVFAPPFLAANPNSPVLNSVTPLQAQKPTKFSFGEDGKISFQPEDSDWIFSAAIRYGRSSNSPKVHHQTYTTGRYEINKYVVGAPAVHEKLIHKQRFSDTQARREENHAILDFDAGKDVGLGLFGNGASSTINFGVRFAQFSSKASVDMRALPDIQYKYRSADFFPSVIPSVTWKLPHFNTYHATGKASRSFRGVGPALSWNGSAPFAGNEDKGELIFDWGINAAMLFGRQKAKVRHQESAHYYPYANVEQLIGYIPAYTHPSAGHPTNGHDTDRSVTVPNVGGFAGVSWRVQDFKVSMGYRVDVFFGAMDTGIDVVKKSNLTFNGPYASISVGLGD